MLHPQSPAQLGAAAVAEGETATSILDAIPPVVLARSWIQGLAEAIPKAQGSATTSKASSSSGSREGGISGGGGGGAVKCRQCGKRFRALHFLARHALNKHEEEATNEVHRIQHMVRRVADMRATVPLAVLRLAVNPLMPRGFAAQFVMRGSSGTGRGLQP